MFTVSSTLRIASTAAWSADSFSPRPIHRAAAIAAASVTRTSSSAMLRSGAGRLLTPPDPMPASVLRTQDDAVASDRVCAGHRSLDDDVLGGTAVRPLVPRVLDRRSQVVTAPVQIAFVAWTSAHPSSSFVAVAASLTRRPYFCHAASPASSASAFPAATTLPFRSYV